MFRVRRLASDTEGPMDDRTLADLFTPRQLESYMQARQVAPPQDQPLPPIAVEHRGIARSKRVNFVIKGVADFGPEAYRDKREEAIRAAIVNAMQLPPEQGAVFWLPEVYYEVTDTWDEGDEYAAAPREAVQETPQARGDISYSNVAPLVDALNALQERFEVIAQAHGKKIGEIARELADERAARLLESATRGDGGARGGLAPVHARGGGDVPDGPGAGDGAHRRNGKRRSKAGRTGDVAGADAGAPRADGGLVDQPRPDPESVVAATAGVGSAVAEGAEAADPAQEGEA